MKNKILIVGLGVIGGSYAKGLFKAGYEIHAIDLSIESLNLAISDGYVLEGKTEVSKEYIQSFDRIVFALYPSVFLKWIKQYFTYFKPGTIFCDVSGVKRPIVNQIQSLIPKGVEFIPTHPMGGREKSGVAFSDEKVFIGANYIITPTDMNTSKGIDFAKELATALQFSHIAILTPEEHDKMVGFLSQLTHCIAVSLMTCQDSTDLSEYTGDSFRDLTRIANINEEMWPELFILNKDYLVKEIDSFTREMIRMKEAIEKEDVDTLKRMMITSTIRRSYFNKKEEK